ncbi:MAG: VTT domain-containing protein [Candidatus Omnitrophica bacterium]|nr:VTT domain-containing protein [Candidatus Omnitrophota bacterium]
MDRLAEQFIAFVNTPWTPVLLFVHSFLEASFLPGAHDFFIVAVTVIKPHLWFYFAIFSTVGSTCGGCFGYFIGRYGGRPLIERIIHPKIADKIEKSYEKFGLWAVAFAGFTPVPYKLFAIMSGIFKINVPAFAVISLFARGARFFLVSGLIFFIGPQIKEHLLDSFNTFSLIALSSVFLLIIIIKLINRRLRHD